MTHEPIHGVANLHALAHRAVTDELRARGAHLTPERLEDVVSYVTERALRFAKRYDQARTTASFSTLAYGLMRRRYTDWLRDDNGDSRYGNDNREVAVGDTSVYVTGQAVDEQSFKQLVSELDHDRLSGDARAALHLVAPRLAEGWTVTQIALELGKPRKEIRQARELLRGALYANA